MSVDGSVEGGLAEPTELEPEQGSLDLASPEDRYTRADWEAATAAVLRKTKRMTDDDADALVWDKLTRTTLDGIEVAPLGTPDLLDDLHTAGRPTRAGDWDVRALHAAPRQRGAAPRPRRRRHLAVAAGRRRHRPSTAVLNDVLLDLAPVVLDAGDAQVAAAEAFLDVLGDTPAAPGTNLGGRERQPGRGGAAGPGGRRARRGRRRHGRPRPGCLRRAGARLLDGGRGGVPPRAHRAGLHRRRGGRPDGVPLRRHRRAVLADRQAAGRAPAVGAGAGAERGRRHRRSGSTS